MKRMNSCAEYYMPSPIMPHAQFTFVNVFRESVRYCRIWNLPFNSVSVCIRDDPSDPSFAEDLTFGSTHIFRKHDIVFKPSGTPARCNFNTGNERLCIHFRLEIFPGIDVFSGGLPRKAENNPALRRECEKIFAISDPIRRLAELQVFTMKIVLRYWPEKYPFEFHLVKPFEPVLQYVREHINAELGVGALSGIVGYSEGYFTRSFHAVFRMSPKKFLQKELFAKAAFLLSSPEQNVKSAAVELHFSSEYYFSKFFKRMSGLPPNEYRKKFLQIYSNVRK